MDHSEDIAPQLRQRARTWDIGDAGTTKFEHSLGEEASDECQRGEESLGSEDPEPEPQTEPI